MTWVAVAIGGGALLGYMGSQQQAGAATSAAGQQYAATQDAARQQREMFDILNKQLANSGIDCGQALQKAVGNRIIFQMDQRQLGNQALLRNERQCGEDANLDSGIALFDCGNPSQKPKTARKPSQYFADFERSPV